MTLEESMRPTWLVEAGVYGTEADPLLGEVRRQGIAPLHARYQPPPARG